jgi:hypothetical protein
MQLRRVILLIAVILGVTAVAASLAPAPRSTQAPSTAPPSQTATTPPRAPATPPTIAFAAPSPKRPPVRTVRAGDHVVVEVDTATAGEASIPALGLSGSAEPGTPATFDVIVPAGRAPIMFAPTLGPSQTIGTLAGTS